MITNPTKSCNPGDIIKGKKNKNIDRSPHYIIYLGPYGTSEDFFLGAMLSTSPDHGNTALLEEHFEKTDEHGNTYKVYYKNSYISTHKYLKKMDWAPFTKQGQLSKRGLEFVIKIVGHLKPEFFPYNQ